MTALAPNQRLIIGVAIAASIMAGFLTFAHFNSVVVFGIAGLALATLVATVGEATDQLGERLSPGATGVLQSAIGNLLNFL